MLKTVYAIFALILLAGCTSSPQATNPTHQNNNDNLQFIDVNDTSLNNHIDIQIKHYPFTGKLTVAAGADNVGYVVINPTDAHIFSFPINENTYIATFNLTWDNPKNDLDLIVYAPSCDRTMAKGDCYENKNGTYLNGDSPVTMVINDRKTLSEVGDWGVACWGKLVANQQFNIVVDVYEVRIT